MVDRINKFLIGSWITYFDYSIMSQEEQMKRLVRLGINYQPFPYSWYQPETRDDLEDWKEIDRLCQKYDVLYGMKVATGKGDEEEIFQKSISFGKQMSDNLIVYHLKDEPRGDELAALGEWIRRYRAANDRVMPAFNLFPSYVTVRTLGCGYREYLQRTLDEAGSENINFLSIDYYPFKMGRTLWSMFADLEDARAIALKNGGLKTHGFLQSNQWNGMRMPNIDEIRWQAYAHIAYGFKALSYFNIVTPKSGGETYTKGLIFQDGSIGDEELLEAVGELNAELHAVGNQVFHMQALHTYHTHDVCKDIELLPEEFIIRPLEKEQKYVITEWDDERYFMLFNNDFEREVEGEFIVKGVNKLSVFNTKTQNYEPCKVENERLKVNFKKGEGLLFRKD